MKVTIDVPDNATNGDMIKALYPEITVEEYGEDIAVDYLDNMYGAGFYTEWWNALYDRECHKDTNVSYVG